MLESKELKYMKNIFSMKTLYSFDENDIIIYWINSKGKTAVVYSSSNKRLTFQCYDCKDSSPVICYCLNLGEKNKLVEFIEKGFNIKINRIFPNIIID